MFRPSAAVTGLGSVLKSELARVDQAQADALADATEGLKNELRQDTAAVLGTRVSLAWRSRQYPNKGQASGPAGFVWSKAPRILDFFSADRVVTPLGQAFAIPVNPVIQRRGRQATIAEVEQRFGKLQAIPLRDGNLGLFATLVKGSGGRLQAAKGRRQRAEKVLMFVLVRSLRSVKLIDIEAAAARAANRYADAVGAILGR